MKKVAAISVSFLIIVFSFSTQFLVSKVQAGCCAYSTAAGICIEGGVCNTQGSVYTYSCADVAGLAQCSPTLNDCNGKQVNDPCTHISTGYSDYQICNNGTTCVINPDPSVTPGPTPTPPNTICSCNCEGNKYVEDGICDNNDDCFRIVNGSPAGECQNFCQFFHRVNAIGGSCIPH